MGQPVHKFLEEFTGDEGHSSRVVQNLRPRYIERLAAPEPMAQKLHEAYVRGRQEGEARVRSVIDAEMVALVADCERQIDAIKTSFAETTADRLAHEMRAGLVQAGSYISQHVATILLPLLHDRIAEIAIRDFAVELRMMVEGAQAIEVDLSGPEELIERLSLLLENDAAWKAGCSGLKIRRVASEQPELRCVVDRSVIETRLAEWLGRIDEVMR